MRTIVVTLLMLVVAGRIAVRSEIATAPEPQAANQRIWVRTVHGWETLDSLRLLSPPRQIALHPGILAAGQLCGSLLALVACSRNER